MITIIKITTTTPPRTPTTIGATDVESLDDDGDGVSSDTITGSLHCPSTRVASVSIATGENLVIALTCNVSTLFDMYK